MELQIKDLARVEVLKALELYKKAYEEKWGLLELKKNNMYFGLCHYFDDLPNSKSYKFLSELIYESMELLGMDGLFFGMPPFEIFRYTDLHEDCIAPRIQLLETMLHQIDEQDEKI
jgi:hypothetical protein